MKKSKDPLKDFYRILSKKNFKNEAELRKFLDSVKENPLPELSPEELSKEERAQDLVEEAYDLPIRDAIKNIDIALNFNPDCIEAYEFLGSVQRSLGSAIKYYKDGIEIGKRIFGGDYLKANIGHFWGIHETRPFMRCMYQYADCMYGLGNKESSISVMEEMIELNPNDNLGVRDQLMLYLLEKNDLTKFKIYAKLFKGDVGAFAHFNHALFVFKKDGDCERSNKHLKKAIKDNKFLLPMLVSSKEQKSIPDRYEMGSKDEAKYYAAFAHRIWQQTPGAVKWLMKFRKSSLNK